MQPPVTCMKKISSRTSSHARQRQLSLAVDTVRIDSKLLHVHRPLANVPHDFLTRKDLSSTMSLVPKPQFHPNLVPVRHRPRLASSNACTWINNKSIRAQVHDLTHISPRNTTRTSALCQYSINHTTTSIKTNTCTSPKILYPTQCNANSNQN